MSRDQIHGLELIGYNASAERKWANLAASFSEAPQLLEPQQM